MSILRTVGKFFGGLIFYASLSLLVIMLTVFEFTQYPNMKSALSFLIEGISSTVDDVDYGEIHSELMEKCEGKESISVDVIGTTLTINCQEVSGIKPEVIGDFMVSGILDVVYYRKYDCNFIECFSQLEGGDKIMLLM